MKVANSLRSLKQRHRGFTFAPPPELIYYGLEPPWFQSTFPAASCARARFARWRWPSTSDRHSFPVRR